MATYRSSMIIILGLLLGSVCQLVSGANNTTQFENFTVEWEDFNLLTCAVPTTINVSLFTCARSIGFVEVNDIDCLESTMFNFDQNVCAITATTTAYISTNAVTTAQMTTTGRQTTVITTGGTNATITPTVAGGTNATSMGSATVTTVTTREKTVTSPAAGGTVATSTGSTTTTSATTGGTNVVLTSSTTTPSATTGGTNIALTSSTATPSATTGGTNVALTSSTPMTTAVSTSQTPMNIYWCPSEAYIGTHCNASADACAMSQPCQHAATCYPNNTLPYGYRCNCHEGYSGYNCEYDGRACTENTCWHNGTCIPANSTVTSNNGSSFTCECTEGYNGRYCELEINLCVNITCENRGVCSTIRFQWYCYCLDSSLYYGEYCQYKTNKLRIREILSTSFASIAIGVIVTTCGFVIIMDILKYAFNIDPVIGERESYRQRREDLKRARRPIRHRGPRFALRFEYVS